MRDPYLRGNPINTKISKSSKFTKHSLYIFSVYLFMRKLCSIHVVVTGLLTF